MSENFSLEEQQAVMRLRSGGPEAQADYFDQRRDELRVLARFRMNRQLNRRVDESDVLQEAYLEYRKRLHRYLESPQLPPTTWLRRIVRQVISRLSRTHIEAKCRDVRRERFVSSSCCVNLDYLSESLTSMGTRMVKQESGRELVAAVEAMSPIEREILTLVHFESKTIRQAADEIGIHLEATKKRYRRALNRLRTVHEESLAASSA